MRKRSWKTSLLLVQSFHHHSSFDSARNFLQFPIETVVSTTVLLAVGLQQFQEALTSAIYFQLIPPIEITALARIDMIIP